MPGEEGIRDLRHHGLFVTQDALEKRPALCQARDEVLSDLVLHRPMHPVGGAERRPFERAERRGESGH